MRLFLHTSCCTKSYFDCVMSTPRLKVKVANIFVMVFVWCKKKKKITANYKSFGKMNLVILRSHRKVHQNFLFKFEDNLEKKFVFYQTRS